VKNMPRGDKTGPNGLGPMTGRAAGYCAGYSIPGYANPTIGYGRGMARRLRRGAGRGFGRRGLFPVSRPIVQTASPKQEIAALEDYQKQLEEEKNQIKKEEENIKSRIEELKNK
jgi:hypothetical protein